MGFAAVRVLGSRFSRARARRVRRRRADLLPTPVVRANGSRSARTRIREPDCISVEVAAEFGRRPGNLRTMRRRVSTWSVTFSLLSLAVGACSSSHSTEPGSTPHIAPAALDEAALARGEALMNRHQCVVCHAPSDAVRARLEPEPAPNLAAIGARKTPDALRRWILAPHAEKASTAMPDLLARLPHDERQQVADDLSQFLAALGGPSERRGPRSTSSSSSAAVSSFMESVASRVTRRKRAPRISPFRRGPSIQDPPSRPYSARTWLPAWMR